MDLFLSFSSVIISSALIGELLDQIVFFSFSLGKPSHSIFNAQMLSTFVLIICVAKLFKPGFSLLDELTLTDSTLP